ncbi:translation initiation factor IF-2 subunit gamma [Nanobdella aerobiophila]|uniref:protein-synthesizing GTPase n=1 Tax=Nanobdella aerobiophila TaxID=2586965 RepID=A0A915SAB6_9ARCH|nr:translation initiation factor IF-2 subunit gamma [Nanobdella aerobiophila]BBL45637.1 translation initiation factor IF-2 subunit gamma [Nanobdella aerobiophila]
MDQIIYPDLSIIILGHVDHGKTTLAKALTGQWLSKHSEEIKRGLTIKLGYSDFTIYRCEDHGYFTEKICPICGKENAIIKKISVVDAPGHESLLMIMLTGAAIVDAAILVIAANEPVPQPQTLEHLIAFKYMGNKPLIIVQNKIDLVSKEEAIKNYNDIIDLLKKLEIDIKNVKIIPISAINNININYILEALIDIKKDNRDINSDPIFLISRSFDINKPGTDIEKLVGGILGGALLKGKLKKDDNIEIRPGLFIDNQWKPIKTKIVSLKQGNIDVDEIIPGGTAGIGTNLDPFVTKEDTLAGQMLGLENKLPNQYNEIKVKYEIIKELFNSSEKMQKGEDITVVLYNMISNGIIKNMEKNNMITIKLERPILGYENDRVLILRKINKRWKIYAIGELINAV